MTPIMRHARFVTVLLGTVAFGQMCIAGTWIDDFSDRTLEDWGRPGQFKDDRCRVGVNKGRFNFRGKSEMANLTLGNSKIGEIHDFTLEMKFMFRRVEVPEKSSWGISYGPEDGGRLRFGFEYSLGVHAIPNTAFISVVPPPNGPVFKALADARFEYEEEKWYTLKIEVRGNRYLFWIENFGLEKVDDSLPTGWIELQFVGRCDIWLDDLTVAGPTVPDGGPGSLRAVLASDKLTTTWGKLKVRD